jgi:hypothetical protein
LVRFQTAGEFVNWFPTISVMLTLRRIIFALAKKALDFGAKSGQHR